LNGQFSGRFLERFPQVYPAYSSVTSGPDTLRQKNAEPDRDMQYALLIESGGSLEELGDMFDIGMQELITVAIVALIVLGPEGIPSAARQCGRVFVQIKKVIRDLKFMVRDELEKEGADE
jgi:Tat protein translocase TatB subunit